MFSWLKPTQLLSAFPCGGLGFAGGWGWALYGVSQDIIRKEYLWAITGKARLGKSMPLARLKPPLGISKKTGSL